MTESEVLDELFAASDNELEQQIPNKNTENESESEPQSENEELEELEKKNKRKSSKKEFDYETSQTDGKLIHFIAE